MGKFLYFDSDDIDFSSVCRNRCLPSNLQREQRFQRLRDLAQLSSLHNKVRNKQSSPPAKSTRENTNEMSAHSSYVMRINSLGRSFVERSEDLAAQTNESILDQAREKM